MPHTVEDRLLPFTVDDRDVWEACGVEGWNMSFFGTPKLKFQCGNCLNIWQTRDYFPAIENGDTFGTLSFCTACTELNFADVIFD